MTSDQQDGGRKIPDSILQLFAESPLYAILDTAAHPAIPLESAVEALLRAGVRVIQYRHKDPFRRAHFAQCQALARTIRAAGGVFVIDDRADVADLSGADGVHLGQEDLSPEYARRFLGETRLIGYSTHTLDQARRAAELPVDYVAIGPVFPTQTKQTPDPVVGLGLVSEVRALTNKPLVAIGGITMENAPSVLAAGADAVAVVRDLLAASDLPSLEERARRFLSVLRTGSRKSEPRP